MSSAEMWDHVKSTLYILKLTLLLKKKKRSVKQFRR